MSTPLNPPIGIAFVGAGLFPKKAYLPALVELPSSLFSLKAVYSRSEQSAASLAHSAENDLAVKDVSVYFDGQGGLDAVLERQDIQAVIVALPITDEPDFILEALKAGKHVLSEKPVGKDIATAESLIEEYNKTYKPKGLIWRVAENFEAETRIQRAAEVIRSGVLGDLTAFSLTSINSLEDSSLWKATSWRATPTFQGGFILDAGVHFAAALRVILPSPIKSISALTTQIYPDLPPTDTFNALVQLESGIQGTVHISFAPPPGKPSEFAIEAWGSKGWLSVDQAGKVVVRGQGLPVGEDEALESDGVRKETESFLTKLAGEEKADWETEELGRPEATLRDLAFIEAGLKSKGNSIELASLLSI